ncbi:chemotaxis protein CheW [Pelosinus sp. sgz500959]|uniref:hybrid sensor histidine kinase/response regulator n=1 Tax=Pelosinus sp. sgz500959 TaxID=3242472 RepID=UPI0036730873
MEQDRELLNEFVIEAKAHIAEIEAGLLYMEGGEENDEIVNEIFRAAHSIKGTASFFELDRIVELSHIIENLFGEFREHRLEVSSEMIDALLSATDVLKELINHPTDSRGYDISDHMSAIKYFLDSSQNQISPLTERSGALSAWELWDQISLSDEQVKETPTLIPDELIDEPVEQTAAREAIVALPILKQQEGVPKGDKLSGNMTEDTVRVNVSLLNDLLNLVGEMVLRRNQLLRIAKDSGKEVAQLEMVAQGINELTTKLQKKVMKSRMQPIANVFNKFPRIVRDMSRKTGKEVDLVMQGMNFELDRSLIEALVDPITHLVRNALDHGIELPDVRKMKNKPLVGSLLLSAYPEGGRMVVDICDDGGGINLEKVKDKAVEKGLINKKEIANMCEGDIFNFIMAPGFSTAERVTDISGRGVGMDVVKTNIEKLGGKIEILSDIGVGTKFRLILPLTLAIISALIVEANGQLFAIPQDDLRELVLIWSQETSGNRIEFIHNRPVLRLREGLIPIIRLSEVMDEKICCGVKEKFDDFVDDDQVLRILIVKSGSSSYGLIVDSVYDMEEILVKPLSVVISSCSLYSGMTVLGDGSIAMILDTGSLRFYGGICLAEDKMGLRDVRATKTIDEEQQYLLLFKCSGGEMLGLDLGMVSRVEEVDVSRLQKIGSKYYFSFQGQTIRVIRPEHYLPISQKKNKPSKVYIILPKLVSHVIGIIAEEIHDTIQTRVSMDKDGVCGVGILGSTLINDTVVTLLNLHVLFAKAAPEYYAHHFSSPKSEREYYKSGVGDDKRTTILLVEDTPFFLKVIKSYLESDGYEVITAENGHEALERLNQTRVDVVVSDIEMPIMTGIELVRAIRDNEKIKNLPVIALTSLTGDANKEKGLRAGFDIYEYKLDRTRLLDSLRDVLRK